MKNLTTNDRIKHLISFKQLSISSFSREIGLINGVTISKIINQNRKPSSKTIGRIIKAFPDINYDWLVNGEGDMIKGKETSSNNVIEQDEMTVTALQVTKYLNKFYPESSNTVEQKLSKLIDSNHLHVLEFLQNGKNEIKEVISRGFDSIENRAIKIQEKSEISREKFLVAHKQTLEKVASLEKEIDKKVKQMESAYSLAINKINKLGNVVENINDGILEIETYNLVEEVRKLKEISKNK
ncbi:hypothetical protein [uncultured Brevundimonas sp.]|uniref:helix-turn-helix domain-containing protein n=1 Tax=uncultured Brevundimonas sp. TaxID=213418 RepID=UPI0030ED7A11